MRGVIGDGPKIVELRRARAPTQETLAAPAECDTKTIRNVERSKRVDFATLARIGHCLGVGPLGIVTESSAGTQAENIGIAQGWIDAFNARDPDAIAECFTDDGV